jgi:hypothetical protein
MNPGQPLPTPLQSALQAELAACGGRSQRDAYVEQLRALEARLQAMARRGLSPNEYTQLTALLQALRTGQRMLAQWPPSQLSPGTEPPGPAHFRLDPSPLTGVFPWQLQPVA